MVEGEGGRENKREGREKGRKKGMEDAWMKGKVGEREEDRKKAGLDGWMNRWMDRNFKGHSFSYLKQALVQSVASRNPSPLQMN